MEHDVGELLRYAREELTQLAEEGCDTWELERRASLIEAEEGPDQSKQAQALCDALGRLTPSPEFPYEEPSDLE